MSYDTAYEDGRYRGMEEERDRILKLIILIEADWVASGQDQKKWTAEYLRGEIETTARP